MGYIQDESENHLKMIERTLHKTSKEENLQNLRRISIYLDEIIGELMGDYQKKLKSLYKSKRAVETLRKELGDED